MPRFVTLRFPPPFDPFPRDMCCACGGATDLVLSSGTLHFADFGNQEVILLTLPHCAACVGRAPRMPTAVVPALLKATALPILVTVGAVYASNHIRGLQLGSFIFWTVFATGVIACVVAILVAMKNARVRREASVVLTNAVRWHGLGSDLTLLFRSEAYANRVAQAVHHGMPPHH